jgi:coproporphyrinogen III oxidase
MSDYQKLHNPIDITALKNYFLGLQERITSAMSALDGKAFIADEWHKPEDGKLKGYGRTCILDGGNILRKRWGWFLPCARRSKCLPQHPIIDLR